MHAYQITGICHAAVLSNHRKGPNSTFHLFSPSVNGWLPSAAGISCRDTVEALYINLLFTKKLVAYTHIHRKHRKQT